MIATEYPAPPPMHCTAPKDAHAKIHKLFDVKSARPGYISQNEVITLNTCSGGNAVS